MSYNVYMIYSNYSKSGISRAQLRTSCRTQNDIAPALPKVGAASDTGYNRHKKSLLLCVIIILSGIILLPGCGTLKVDASDPITEELMLQALDAIQNDDIDGFKALFKEDVLTEGFTAKFAELQSYYRGEVVSYEAVSKNTNITSGKESRKTVTCVYQVDTTLDNYLVSVTRIEEGEISLLQGFTIVLNEEYTESVTPSGHFSDKAQYTSLQWVLFSLNFLAYGFVAFTITRCLRDKIRYKALFVIISLLQIVFSVTVSSSSFFINFTITPIGLAGQLVYPAGETVTSILIPLGALIYWVIRKKIIRRPL